MSDLPSHEPVSVRFEGVSKWYGGVAAVDDVTLDIEPGLIVGLMGPNGAGKSTLVNMLAGYISSSSGSIFVGDVDVTGWAPHDLARIGVIRTFQRASIFPTLTTVENMLVGPLDSAGETIRAAVRGRRRWTREESSTLPEVWEMIERFKLQQLANAPAGTLSGGQQRLVELGRALLMNPRVLVLDEPTAGVNIGNIDALLDELARLRGSGVTVILVEHNLAVVERLCDTTIFMASGKPIASGEMATVLADENVLAAAANY